MTDAPALLREALALAEKDQTGEAGPPVLEHPARTVRVHPEAVPPEVATLAEHYLARAAAACHLRWLSSRVQRS